MKKVLFVLPSLGVGGLERVLVTFANLFAGAGYDVTVLTFDDGQALASELLPSVRFVHKKPKPHPIGKRIPYIRHRFYDDGLWETRASAKRLYNYYVGKEKYDVEIAFFRGRSVKIVSGSDNPDSIKLAWVHNDYSVCGGVTANFKNEKLLKKAYDAFDCVIPVSLLAAEKFRERIGFSGLVRTVYNPIPIKEIVEKSSAPCPQVKKGFTIVGVGRLVDAKGFDRLIEAFDYAVKRTGRECELWIVGGGEKQESLAKQIADLNLKNVFLLGARTNPFPFMAQADLIVCSSRFEGFNLTVAEGLSLGKPVLSTNCTGPTEILKNGEYGLICENSTKGLQTALTDILSDPEVLLPLKGKAADRAKDFDQGRIMGRLEELLNELQKEREGA